MSALSGLKRALWVFFCNAGKKMVARIGIEPMTHGFSVRCSTS